MGLFDALRSKPKVENVSHESCAPSTTAPNVAIIESSVTPPSDDRKIILLVGSDLNTIDQTRRNLLGMEFCWATHCVTSAGEAVAFAARSHVDVLICDLQLGDMPATALLGQFASQFPRTIRFLRCASEAKSGLGNVAGAPPQVIPLDLDKDTLVETIQRALRLQMWMAAAGLKEMLAKMRQLPSLPTLYTQISSELSSPTGSLEIVATLIAKDPLMTAKILQVVNSAFFSLARQVVDPVEAVMHLGAERTRALIFIAKIFSQFDKTRCANFSIEDAWEHSMAIGTSAMAIAKEETKDARLTELAFTAGLLHDVGKLLLAANVPDVYGQILDQAARRKLSVREVEVEAFSATHAELGACLLGTWGLPVALLEAVAWHHNPLSSEDDAFSITTAVHVANALYYEKRGDITRGHASKLDFKYLHRLKVYDRLNAWCTLCGCPIRPDAQVMSGKARVIASREKRAA
jgi:putative nucleotidyltransferase with HDIG domain